jgi:hypothetical protein
MERFTALPRGMQLMLVAGVLLLIDTFLNWQEVTVLGISAGVNAWHGWGVLVGLLTIALLVWIVARVAAPDIRLPVSDTMAGAALGTLIVLFTLIKILVDNEFRTVWAWIGLVLAVLIAVGAWLEVTAGGGMETLRTEASGLRTRAGGTATTTSPPPPPPQAPPASPPPPPDESPPQGGDRT